MDIRGQAERNKPSMRAGEGTPSKKSAYYCMRKWMYNIKQGGTAGVYLLSRQKSCGQEFFVLAVRKFNIRVRQTHERNDFYGKRNSLQNLSLRGRASKAVVQPARRYEE